MSLVKHLLLVLIAALVLGAATLATVEAQSLTSPGARPAGLVIPEGFKEITSTIGAELLRKDYPGGTPDFVQVVDFSQGAAVELLHGPIQEKRPGEGVYGGDDPRIASRSLKQYWNQFANSEPNPFCVVNGQFFYMPEAPTRLPFSLKVGGEVVSDGYAKDQFPGKKLMLELWTDHLHTALPACTRAPHRDTPGHQFSWDGTPGIRAEQAPTASATGIEVMSIMLWPSMVTASDSGLSLFPSHVGQR